MKQYVKMVIFILVLGAFSALLLIGTDALTKPRIEQNKKIELYSAILDANEIEFASNNDVFKYFEGESPQFVIEEKEGLERYLNTDNGNYSFIFEGAAMWGPVKGLMTLKSDFQTIVALKILEQEETPGLGAEITNPNFLIKFKEVKFDPIISITEIGTIAGATNTTGFLQKILNSEFEKFYRNFVGDDLFNTDGTIMELLLESIDVELKDGESLSNVFNTHFETLKEGELKVYLNKSTNKASFSFEPTLRFAQDGIAEDEIIVVVTLDTDFKTISGMYVNHDGNTGQWGKSQLLTKENLAKAVGKTLPVKSLENNTGNDLFDGTAGATITKNDLELALNNEYAVIFSAFDGKLEVSETIKDKVVKKLLDNINVSYTDNFNQLFEDNFKETTKNGLTTYENKTNGNYSYYFTEEFTFGVKLDAKEDVTIIVTFSDDFETIVRVNALHDKNGDHFGKTLLLTDERLEQFIGQSLTEKLTFDFTEADDKVAPTTTRSELLNYLEEKHQLYIDAFVSLTLEEQVKKILLQNINVEVKLEVNDLFNEHFTTTNNLGYTLYTNKVNGNVSYMFNEEYSYNRNTPDKAFVPVIVTLKADFDEIVKVNAITDEIGGWAKRDLFIETKLDELIGQRGLTGVLALEFPNASEPTGAGAPSVTRNELLEYLKDYQAIYNNVFKLDLSDDLLIKANILNNNGIKLNGDIDTLITNKFNVTTNGSLTLYTNKENNNVTFAFTEEFSYNRNTPDKADATIIITLKAGYDEIVKVSAITGDVAGWAKRDLFIESKLDELVGQRVLTGVLALEFPNASGPTGAGAPSVTRNELLRFIKTNVTNYSSTFGGGN